MLFRSEIISINPDEEEDSFGYSPTPELEGEQLASEKKIEKKQKPPTKSEQERILDKELLILKEKRRGDANEMFIKGLYTKKEYKDEIERINNLKL